jgi:hypothetical protein
MFYLELFAALDRHKVDYLLIGGLAVTLHGVERSTMDVDITVATSPSNLAALVETAKDLKLTPVLPVPLESPGNIELLREWHVQRNLEAFALRAPELDGVTIDVLLFPPVDFSGMLTRAEIFEVAGTAIKVVSINDLIAMKKAVGRPIDLSDVEHLQRIKSA